MLTKHYLHLGRVTSSALIDIVKVKGLIQREMGYRRVTFTIITTTLDYHLLMSGFDARRSRHSNPRANVFGVEKQKLLFLMIFPFIDNKLKILNLKKCPNPTALRFLEMLQNLRSVIIQDCATLTLKLKHVILNKFPHIFKSDLFLNYSNKMMDYLDFCEKNSMFTWCQTMFQKPNR